MDNTDHVIEKALPRKQDSLLSSILGNQLSLSRLRLSFNVRSDTKFCSLACCFGRKAGIKISRIFAARIGIRKGVTVQESPLSKITCL